MSQTTNERTFYEARMAEYDKFARMTDWTYPYDGDIPAEPLTFAHSEPAPERVTLDQLLNIDRLLSQVRDAVAACGHPGYSYGWRPEMHDMSVRAHVAFDALAGWRTAMLAAAGIDPADWSQASNRDDETRAALVENGRTRESAPVKASA